MESKINLNQPIITTKYILQGSIIKEVVRDEDGDWQFYGGENITEKDAVVLSLKQILDIDISVSDILHIPSSTIAYRDNLNSKWNLRKLT